ncbi:hypothetical protein QVD99_000943 [Batrachochytrium dendrobatidis]|nr:hypothetical protein O5D80_003795 [Batrachochytrium dendrobatidis]KAK5673501.1 hypothetical protein QVD99_000943 [Batrachochytrium dendrobatidis]
MHSSEPPAPSAPPAPSGDNIAAQQVYPEPMRSSPADFAAQSLPAAEKASLQDQVAAPAPAYTPYAHPTASTIDQSNTSQPICIQPMMIQPVSWGRRPQPVKCNTCNNAVLTQTTTHNGLAMWLSVGLTCLVLPCCCWIPLLINDLQDVSHDCPVCQAHLGDAKLIR